MTDTMTDNLLPCPFCYKHQPCECRSILHYPRAADTRGDDGLSLRENLLWLCQEEIGGEVEDEEADHGEFVDRVLVVVAQQNKQRDELLQEAVKILDDAEYRGVLDEHGTFRENVVAFLDRARAAGITAESQHE